MKNNILLLTLFIVGLLQGCNPSANNLNNFFEPEKVNDLRAPAYPLVTIDPYTSGWSFTNQLNGDEVRHWTAKKFPLTGAIRVDGVTYRFMGMEETPLKAILPSAKTEKWEAVYTEKMPSKGWELLDFNDKNWKTGRGAFGTEEMPYLATPWDSKDIWVRRTFELDEDYSNKPLILEYSHDDIFELYINGIQVIATEYEWGNRILVELPQEVKNTLKSGKNIVAAHCHNLAGGGYVDFGLFLEEDINSSFEKVAVQKSASVLPTQTYYTFECGPVELDLIFTAPLLMDDLELISSPVNYISYQVKSSDGKAHDVQLYVEATAHWAVHMEDQPVTYNEEVVNNMTYLSAGTIEQPVLGKKGDNVRIDWGYFYLASPVSKDVSMGIGEYHKMKGEFIEKGKVTGELDLQALSPDLLTEVNVLAYVHDLGSVSSKSQGHVLIGYDDLYSIQYFHDNRMAYWKQDGKVSIYDVFEKANKNYIPIMERCFAFDNQMMEDAKRAGGKEYAELCALAYRQSISAHKLIKDKEGNLLFLSKENFSNGSIGTVDITYPSSPLYLIYNPDLLKGMMTPIFYYSESGQWNKPYPSHDIGTYPIANGQTYGEDMPVEEAGNMLILTAAISEVEGNVDYAKKHWEVLTVWANYLLEEGLDPGNQLCTDDFAGHLAHNANLSVKAIMGIAGYGKMAEMLGEKEVSEKYIQAAKEMAGQWMEMAIEDNHYRLTFDQPGTWSQKYNLIWDKIFGWDIFPQEVAQKEVAFYLTKQQRYGLPLDSRKTYTKSDWVLWSACLAENPVDFQALIHPIYLYANETESRMPISDWHETTDGISPNFRARSVVGGYFMKMLETSLNP